MIEAGGDAAPAASGGSRPGVPVSPRRVFGVDFSGARDAGRHVWVCRGVPGQGGVRVESVDPLVDLPGGARERSAAMDALVGKVVDAPRSAWGFDFPFGLPKGLLEGSPRTSAGTGRSGPRDSPESSGTSGSSGSRATMPSGWSDHVAAVAALGSAEELRDRCREAADGKELRRRTDREASTPLSPYNLRIFKQTWHGIVDVLAPLRGRPGIAVLPMDPLPSMLEGAPDRPGSRPAHTYVLEVCPASTIADLGWAGELGRYKGREPERRERREEILKRLVAAELVRPMRVVMRRGIVDDARGDAVDAVLAAVAAWRGARSRDHNALRFDPDYSVEGYVYT